MWISSYLNLSQEFRSNNQLNDVSVSHLPRSTLGSSLEMISAALPWWASTQFTSTTLLLFVDPKGESPPIAVPQYTSTRQPTSLRLHVLRYQYTLDWLGITMTPRRIADKHNKSRTNDVLGYPLLWGFVTARLLEQKVRYRGLSLLIEFWHYQSHGLYHSKRFLFHNWFLIRIFKVQFNMLNV